MSGDVFDPRVHKLVAVVALGRDRGQHVHVSLDELVRDAQDIGTPLPVAPQPPHGMAAIERAAADKRAELTHGKADVHALKGALALNALDDSRPELRDEARAMLDSYATARGESGWSETAHKIIAARNVWAGRMMALEMMEDGAWRALQGAQTRDDIDAITHAIINAISEV